MREQARGAPVSWRPESAALSQSGSDCAPRAGRPNRRRALPEEDAPGLTLLLDYRFTPTEYSRSAQPNLSMEVPLSTTVNQILNGSMV